MVVKNLDDQVKKVIDFQNVSNHKTSCNRTCFDMNGYVFS